MDDPAVTAASPRSRAYLFLNDVALAGGVEGLLSLGLRSLSLLLLLLFSELLDPLQLLLERSCLDGHNVPDLCRQRSVIIRYIMNTLISSCKAEGIKKFMHLCNFKY